MICEIVYKELIMSTIEWPGNEQSCDRELLYTELTRRLDFQVNEGDNTENMDKGYG